MNFSSKYFNVKRMQRPQNVIKTYLAIYMLTKASTNKSFQVKPITDINHSLS